MATLKIQTARGFDWVCDVQSIQTGDCWETPAEHFECPGEAKKVSGGPFEGYNCINHSIHPKDFRESVDEAPRESHIAVEILVCTTHAPNHDRYSQGTQYNLHIVSANEAWLMGDDGRTIDRIP